MNLVDLADIVNVANKQEQGSFTDTELELAINTLEVVICYLNTRRGFELALRPLRSDVQTLQEFRRAREQQQGGF